MTVKQQKHFDVSDEYLCPKTVFKNNVIWWIALIDNTVQYDSRMFVFQTVCSRLGIEVNDRLSSESKKRKFLVKSLAPESVRNKNIRE